MGYSSNHKDKFSSCILKIEMVATPTTKVILKINRFTVLGLRVLQCKNKISLEADVLVLNGQLELLLMPGMTISMKPYLAVLLPLRYGQNPEFFLLWFQKWPKKVLWLSIREECSKILFWNRTIGWWVHSLCMNKKETGINSILVWEILLISKIDEHYL